MGFRPTKKNQTDINRSEINVCTVRQRYNYVTMVCLKLPTHYIVFFEHD